MNNRETIIENLMAIRAWADNSMIALNGVKIAETIDGALDALNSVVYCKDCKHVHMTCNGENKCCDIRRKARGRMKTRYRYYCLDKPPMPGTVPRGMIHIEDFKEVRYIDAIGCEACGYAEYDRILTESEIKRHKMMADPTDSGGGDDYCDF